MKDRESERIQNIDASGPGELIDLSTSGVALLLPQAIENDQNVSLYLNDLKIEAKVIYSLAKGSYFRIGLQFLNISENILTNLSEMVDKFSKGIPLKCRLDNRQ